VVLTARRWRFSVGVEDLEKRCQIEYFDCHGEHWVRWNMGCQVSGSDAPRTRSVGASFFVPTNLDPIGRRFETLGKAGRCNVGLQTPGEIGTDRLDLV